MRIGWELIENWFRIDRERTENSKTKCKKASHPPLIRPHHPHKLILRTARFSGRLSFSAPPRGSSCGSNGSSRLLLQIDPEIHPFSTSEAFDRRIVAYFRRAPSCPPIMIIRSTHAPNSFFYICKLFLDYHFDYYLGNSSLSSFDHKVQNWF